MFRALQCPSSGACQTAVADWFPYECAGGSVLSRGRFVDKPTTAENTSTSTFTWKPEAVMAV
jgi:ferredoxin